MKKNILTTYYFFLFIGCPVALLGQFNNSFSGGVKSNHFIQNIGQVVDQNGIKNPDVLFLLNTPGLKVQLKKDGFSYDFYSKKSPEKRKSIPTQNAAFPYESSTFEPSTYNFHRLDVTFLNSNEDIVIKTLEQGPSQFAYLDDDQMGRQRFKSFKRVVYQNLYDKIDLEFVVPNSPLKPVEYNFIVHPDGKISDIKMKFSGAPAQMKEDHLKFSLALGEMKEVIPKSWFENNGNISETEIVYTAYDQNIYGFKTANPHIRNRKGKLIIDPTPVRLWATYYGGEDEEAQYDAAMATDNNGNVFISGYTRSFNNIATNGSFRNTYTNDSHNGYLAKFRPDGTLEWATYYGERRTLFRSISVDTNGNVIGVGETYSTGGMATPGAHQGQLYNHPNNYVDGFIVKFDTNGQRLWGTYFGGESAEYCTGVSVDNTNNIYISGHTASNANIATAGAFRNTGTLNVHGNWDPFLLKMDSDGNLLWSTYYGGQYGVGLDVDSNGNVYMTGITYETYPPEDIATPGSYQEQHSDEGSLNWSDTFLVKFDTNGNRLWGTYYGGDSYDDGHDVVVDQSDNVIICGSTRSNVFPTTENAHQRTKTAEYYDYNAFLAKFDTNGSILWNTLYGGEDSTSGLGVAVDLFDNVFLTGGTLSFNNIATANSFKETKGDNNIPNHSSSAAYLVKFNTAGVRQWGTYYGGDFYEEGLNVKTDVTGDIYLLGFTFGSTTLATSGSHQENYYDSLDNFLVKFKDCESAIVTEVPTGICEGDTIFLEASGGIAYEWTGPNGFFSTDAEVEITNATQLNSGVYTLEISALDGCDDTRTFEINVTTRPTIGHIDDLFACADDGNSGFSTIFDTSGIHQAVMDNQTNVDITYFDGTGTVLPSPLPDTMSNTIANNEIITVRVADSNNPACYAETSFELQVGANPEIHPVDDIFECDSDGDGYALFDLSQIESLVMGNQTGMQVLGFDGAGNSLGATLPISYTNSIPNEEILTIRVQNELTGCFSDTTLRLLVGEIPRLGDLTPLFGCDDNDDGISEGFDTSGILETVLEGQEGMAVSFFDENGLEMNPLPNPFTNTVPNTEILTIRVSNIETGCYSETQLVLNAVSQPEVIVPGDRYACNDGSGIGIFNIETLSDEILSNTENYSLTVRAQDGTSISNDLTKFESTGETISILVEDVNNPICFAEFTLNLIVNEFLDIGLQDSYGLCALEPSIQLQVPTYFQTIEWYDENDVLVSNGTTATITDEGSYLVLATSYQNGIACTYVHDLSIVRSDLPVINDVRVEQFGATSMEIMASGDGDFEYSIDGFNFQDSNYFEIIEGGTYTVMVRDKNNCGEDSTPVIVLNYPRFFTPNNDNINDTWRIQGLNEYPNTRVFIYDRYGKFLVALEDNDIWNGEVNGIPLPSSDYWFKLDMGTGKSYSGHFTLKR